MMNPFKGNLGDPKGKTKPASVKLNRIRTTGMKLRVRVTRGTLLASEVHTWRG